MAGRNTEHPYAEGAKITQRAQQETRKNFFNFLLSFFASSANPLRPLRTGVRFPGYRIRLNHSSDRLADSKASAAAAMARRAEISVSFFSTVRRELSVS
jgi:hypothetical protein